ncbi:hypothetical protein [Lysobacter sp. FW306-1B-D06B]|uniref:hypothetical protein n=1 Tax=Lysobacter sp. FW306-1B-D06B TaxID=3140250 RepID=UPI003140B2A3
MAKTKTQTKPRSLTLRSYDVGFGDCFLLSFHYASFDRHVLIDFGSTRLPTGKAVKGNYMEYIARCIHRDCGGKLTAVVATHRHKDHISGFAMKDGKGSGAIIAALQPDVVLQPWTEDPNAPRNAKVPSKTLPGKKVPVATLMAMHLDALEDMNRYAGFVLDASKKLTAPGLKSLRDQLEFLGDDNELANRSAITNLMTMGSSPARYLYFGAKSGLETLLPGVTTHVLGPPTLKQTDTITKQRSTDEDEFWLARADFWKKRAAVAARPGVAFEPLFRNQQEHRIPLDARWYRNRAQHEQAETMLSIVRSLDAQMNNTSLILLFEVGGKLLLFPGDAQYENWMYALDQEGVAEKLRQVDFYKVGHHGSRNATPKRLWDGFEKRYPPPPGDDDGEHAPHAHGEGFVTLLSTKDHVHGRASADTEVPRQTLVDALETQSTLVDTRTTKDNEIGQCCTLDLS